MATICEALAIAIQHHQAGRRQAAELIYRQILAVYAGLVDLQRGFFMANPFRPTGPDEFSHAFPGSIFEKGVNQPNRRPWTLAGHGSGDDNSDSPPVPVLERPSKAVFQAPIGESIIWLN